MPMTGPRRHQDPDVDGLPRRHERHVRPRAAAGAIGRERGPRGEVGSLAEANEIRIVFSEPMVSLGRIPETERAPFFRISPAATGTFRWSGTTTLIFTPDPEAAAAVRHAYEVTIAATARRSADGGLPGRTRSRSPHRPHVCCARRGRDAAGARTHRLWRCCDSTSRSRPADVMAHLTATFEPHDWAEPGLSDETAARMTERDPEAVGRFRAKVAATRAAPPRAGAGASGSLTTGTRRPIRLRPTSSAIESTTASPSESWVRLALDERLPSPQAGRCRARPGLHGAGRACTVRERVRVRPASAIPTGAMRWCCGTTCA